MVFDTATNNNNNINNNPDSSLVYFILISNNWDPHVDRIVYLDETSSLTGINGHELSLYYALNTLRQAGGERRRTAAAVRLRGSDEERNSEEGPTRGLLPAEERGIVQTSSTTGEEWIREAKGGSVDRQAAINELRPPQLSHQSPSTVTESPSPLPLPLAPRGYSQPGWDDALLPDMLHLAGWFDSSCHAALSAYHQLSGDTLLGLAHKMEAKRESLRRSSSSSNRGHDGNEGATYLDSRTRGPTQYLIIGPWTHGGNQVRCDMIRYDTIRYDPTQ